MSSRLAVAFALGVLMTTRARAQDAAEAPAAVEVRVDGPCVDAAALRFAAGVRAAAHPGARVAVEVRCGDPVHARVQVGHGEQLSTRTLDVSTSELASFVDAIALIIAIALEEVADEPADEPRDAAPPPSPAPRSLPEPPPRTSPPAPPVSAPGAATRWSLVAAVDMLGGLLPDAAIGASLGLGWTSELGLGVEVGVSATAPSDQAMLEGRITYWSLAGRGALCGLADLDGHLALGGCGGAVLGGLSAEPSGYRAENLARWEPWIAVEARARVQISIDALFVRADAIVAGVVLGPSFYIQRLDERIVAHVTAPVVGGAAIGLGVHFGP